ncbi:hypothetical protein SUGI_0010030 [Cryptomeria japonica]|nr:hypothetical protein SUGI_0010030 [Cryptomeria japonica]
MGGMAHLDCLDLSGIKEHSSRSGKSDIPFCFESFIQLSPQGNPNLHGWPLENGTLRSRPDEGGSQAQSNRPVATDTDAGEMDR